MVCHAGVDEFGDVPGKDQQVAPVRAHRASAEETNAFGHDLILPPWSQAAASNWVPNAADSE
ncbi:hypothetical protein GCM10009527_078080 [Actinomadura nitritigenes]